MTGDEANEAQAQRVARLIADAFRDQPEPFVLPDRGKWVGSAPAWISLALTCMVGLFTFGVAASDIKSNTRRIVELEARQNVRERDDRQLLERMARIEAKLDTVLEAK